MKEITFVAFLLMSMLTFGQAPSADFTVNTFEACLGDALLFADQSSPGATSITAWSWDFGDGNSSNLVNPSHTYASPGTYTVTLVTTAQNGQADAEVKVDYITIHDLPNAGFSTSGNGCSIPFDVTFSNTSDPGMNYSWDFGNGQTSTQQSPGSITYTSAGNYTVTISVTNPSTGCSNDFSQDITVSDYTAGFTSNLTGCVGAAITFTDASTVGTNSWNWNFGDGQSGTGAITNHSYSSPGTYTVTLNVQNTSSGCSDVITQDITIYDNPVPSFTSDVTSGCAPLLVNFTNTSGVGTTFEWDFGNGNTFTGQNPPTESYTADGTFDVSLTMTDANGCSATDVQSSLITVSAPVVQFTADVVNGCDPLTVQFTESSTSPDPTGDPIVSWIWDFGDGSAPSVNQTPPPHIYTVGVYDVTLTVTTQNGCQSTLTLPEMIEVGSILNVDFTVTPAIECAKSPIDFIDNTTFGGTPDQGEVIYTWDFGDGGTSAQQSPTYEYAVDTGYFDVQLIVNWRGCIDTLVQDSAVYIKAPISLFQPSQTLFCNPSSFPVTLDVTDDAKHGDLSDDVLMIWKWGDGTQTILDDPALDDANLGDTSHQYNAYGTYEIEQVIYNYTTGCEDSTTQTIHISQTIADFSVSNDSTCVGSPITLTSASTSSHPFGSFTYNLGNAASTSGNPANYTYANSGTYVILLTATNSVGCSDTISFTDVHALDLPVADLTSSDVAGCAPITVDYTNLSSSTGNGVPLDFFTWTFPDQSTQTTNAVGTQTNYTFDTEGNFTTSIIATDEFGCVSTPATVNMSVTKPTAQFTVDSVVCDLESFTALNSSTGAVSYEWFVDGTSVSVDQDFTSAFDEVTSPTSNSVIHGLSLIATDVNGCLDTLDQTIIVSMPRAEVDFVLSGASVNANGEFTCPPVFADFTDVSDTYGSLTNWDWDFGDGKFSTLQDPSNTYVFAGTYTAGLTITDEFGCTDDTLLVDYLTIFGPSGDPSWSDLADICGQTFLFDVDNLNNVSEVIWDLGDGTSINDTNQFNHTYLSYDDFYPTATLLDSLGCEVLYELDTIVVQENGLDAYFEPSITEGPMGSEINYDDQSIYTTSPIVSWTWDFNGDTVVYNSPVDPTQAYGLPGVYDVTLLITDSDGCFDTYATSITITNSFHLPNVITANGDNVNDFFVLPAPIFESFDLIIVNRWGNVVSEIQGGTGTYLWDGRAQSGEYVTDGVYFYTLRGVLVDGETAEKHGNVSVFVD